MKLVKMTLDNFMCYEYKEINFSDRTVISGANGAGKSSIASAYTWVLFDCDYNLKSNPVVRREINGEPVEEDVEVSLTFSIEDGEKCGEITLRKVQKRKYSKDGDTYKDDNKYFINDVSKTKKDFESYLGIDMKVLKACSNIDYFVSQKPEEMREYLFSLVEDVSDSDICKNSPDLEDLGEILEKFTAEELTAMNKKKIADAEKEIPILKGQIKEKNKELEEKSEFDLAELELRRNVIRESIAENRRKQADNQKLLNGYDNALEEVMQLKFKLSDIQNKANAELAKNRGSIGKTISELQLEKNNLSTDIAIKTGNAGSTRIELANLKSERKRYAAQWQAENAREMESDGTICPYCKQELPADESEKLKAEFEVNKQLRLAAIEADGMKTKTGIEKLEKELADIEQEKADLQVKLDSINAKLEEATKKFEEFPKFVDVSENEEYKATLAEISKKEKEMGSFRNFRELKEQLMGEEDDLNEGLRSTERIIDWANTEEVEIRLEELTSRRTELEQNKADAERILFFLDELKKVKNETLSSEINKHFGKVQWKLFDYAKNGNYKSVCIPMMDGKSILSTISNKGNRIIGKADICRSIQKIAGVSIPIWLDDAESLDDENRKKISGMIEGQLIMLVVTGDKSLKVEV